MRRFTSCSSEKSFEAFLTRPHPRQSSTLAAAPAQPARHGSQQSAVGRRPSSVSTSIPGRSARRHRPIVAAFSINEISDRARDGLLPRLIERSLGGDRILVVEPLAGFVAPWGREWRAAFESQGGRSDEWRFRLELPDVVAKLDRAAGLNHRELTGRSLWLGLAHSPGPDELDELD